MGCHLLTDIIKIYLSKGKILYRLLFKTKLSKGGLVEYTGANPRHETPQGQLVVWKYPEDTPVGNVNLPVGTTLSPMATRSIQ